MMFVEPDHARELNPRTRSGLIIESISRWVSQQLMHTSIQVFVDRSSNTARFFLLHGKQRLLTMYVYALHRVSCLTLFSSRPFSMAANHCMLPACPRARMHMASCLMPLFSSSLKRCNRGRLVSVCAPSSACEGRCVARCHPVHVYKRRYYASCSVIWWLSGDQCHGAHG